MLPGSRLLDGPPHHISPEEVISTSADYEFLVLFTSTVGFQSDIRMARAMKEKKPGLKIAFVGPQVQIKPAESLLASQDIDFVVRGEFDHAVVDYAQGKPLSGIANVSYVKDGKIVHNPSREPLHTEELDALPVCHRRLQAQFDDRKIQRALPSSPVCFVLYGAEAARLSARSACGRRRFPATPGASAPSIASPENSARRTRCSRRRRNSSSTTTRSTSARTAFSLSAKNSSPLASSGHARRACTAITRL